MVSGDVCNVNGGAMGASGAVNGDDVADGGPDDSRMSNPDGKPVVGGVETVAGKSTPPSPETLEDPVKRFRVREAMAALRDEKAEPHERMSACERIRDFALADRNKDFDTAKECIDLLPSVFHPFGAHSTSMTDTDWPQDDADIKAAAFRAYIAVALDMYVADERPVPNDWWTPIIDAINAESPSSPPLAQRTSAFDVIGRCADDLRRLMNSMSRAGGGLSGEYMPRGCEYKTEDDTGFQRVVSDAMLFATNVEMPMEGAVGGADTAVVKPVPIGDELWAASLECACRLASHYVPVGDGDAAGGIYSKLGDENERVRGSAARIYSKMPPHLIEPHVESLMALSRDPAPWVRHAAAVAVGKVTAHRAERQAAAESDEKNRLNDSTEAKVSEAAAASSSAADEDAAFVEATERMDAVLKDLARGDRTTDPSVPEDGPHRPDESIAALLSDPCGVVRVAATFTLTKAPKSERVRHLHRLLPNLQARDGYLREATCKALTALWTEEHKPAITPATEPKAEPTTTAGDRPDDAAAKPESSAKPEAAEAVVTAAATTGDDQKPSTHQQHQQQQHDVNAEISTKTTATPAKTKTPGETARLKLMTATAANLAPLLEDPDGGVRECAAECMGHLKEAATSHLAPMRLLMKEDREESVRDAAMDAMTRLGFYNPLSGALKQRGFYRVQRSRGPSAQQRKSSLSRTRACEVGATVRVWWPDDGAFYEARIKAWDRERDVHTLLYILDGVEEELDLKKERVELRYKPHKRGAKESWLPIRDKKEKKEKKAPKVPRVPKEKKPAAPKDPKERRPTRAEVTVEKVKKGQVVPIDATVRVFWPLDDAWYGGRVVGHTEKTSTKVDKETGEAKVTALHTVLYHDGVQEDLDFNKEKVEVVSLGAGAEKVPPIDGLLPLRVPIIGGATKGWMLPNARRGAEQVAVDADTSGNTSGDISGDVTTRMSVLDFNDRFAPPPEKALTKGGAPVVKRWRRMLSFDPARCPPHLAARGGCAKEVSLGRWLANQGAAWGEAVVGRPVFVRARTWTYSPGDYVNAERLAAERHERDVGGSKPVSDNITGEKRKEPEPKDAEEAEDAAADAEVENVETVAKEEPVDETLKAPTILGCSPSKKERSVDDIYSAGPAVTGPDDGPEQKEEKDEDEDESMGKQSDDESMGKDDSDDESEWRFASIVGFNAQTGDHRLLYADGTREWLPLILHETKAASDSDV